MRIKYIVPLVLMIVSNSLSQSYLSNLNAENDLLIYNAYASSPGSSKYSTDQGYQLTWFDPDKGILLNSQQSGNIGMIFRSGNVIKSRLSEYSKPPLITISYSNLFKLFYYPYKGLRTEVSGLVKDSETLILDVTFYNETSFNYELDIFPYIEFSGEGFYELSDIRDGLSFTHFRKADSWMKEHNIPYSEKIYNLFLSEGISDGSFSGISSLTDTSGKYLANYIRKNLELPGILQKDNSVAAIRHSLSLPPGESKTLRIVWVLSDLPFSKEKTDSIKSFNRNVNIREYIYENEDLYKNIPLLKFSDPDAEAVYWNSFNLMRQCFMKPEGKCSYNYYVFSREPKWGWGYGGQVFHESLTMLAYAYLDPLSAMNSQRIYFERQHPDGYINYRTGPYLDEQIPVNGQLTSSAPWFNWQNYEIYKITNDKKFLAEAYESGKKFYEYYISNRDSDNDGLCEWGAHAVLESVRDARVAVWDQVGDPKNFEALDCNLMLVREAKSLAAMAEQLGLYNEQKRFLLDAGRRSDLINKFMWDEETGFYYHVDKKNHTFSFENKNDLKRKEIIAFLALWADVADKHQAEKLISHLNNPGEFKRKFGIPTLSADDPYYNPIGYWNGPVWLPWQYLVFRGLLDYGYVNEAKDLTARIVKNMAYQLKTNHYFWEFYSADDLQAGWNKSYIWSGIIARFFIDINNIK